MRLIALITLLALGGCATYPRVVHTEVRDGVKYTITQKKDCCPELAATQLKVAKEWIRIHANSANPSPLLQQ